MVFKRMVWRKNKRVILSAGIISHLLLGKKILSTFVLRLKNAENFPKIQQNPIVPTIDKQAKNAKIYLCLE